MLHSHYHHHHHLLFSNLHVPLTLTHHSPPSHLIHFLHRPTIIPHTVISAIPPALSSWLTQLTTGTEELGSIGLPFSIPSLFEDTDDPSSTIQLTSTILVTGAVTLFFFRTLQRQAKRAKELKFRSTRVNKSLGSSSSKIKTKKKPPSPDQALLGAVIAGVIAVILYRFTTSIEATLYRQTVSDNFSVRQITITIRTIINGLCYLATFVYGINSVGLLLYSGQLAMNTFERGPSTGKETESRIIEQSGSSNSSIDKLSSTKEDESSNNSQ